MRLSEAGSGLYLIYISTLPEVSFPGVASERLFYGIGNGRIACSVNFLTDYYGFKTIYSGSAGTTDVT